MEKMVTNKNNTSHYINDFLLFIFMFLLSHFRVTDVKLAATRGGQPQFVVSSRAETSLRVKSIFRIQSNI